MTKKTIEIFRVGTHVGMDGKSYTFSRDDLLATAAAYDPAVFSAPAVIGHPKVDDPAYGWATSMRVDGDVLLADLDQVEPAFAELVNAGRYKKVSPFFYPPEGKTNPVPGVYYPRHIGFLGAAAPGCQGLAPVAFAEGDDEFIGFSSDPEVVRPVIWLARLVGRLMRRQRDQVIEAEGVEEANKLFPEWEADAPADIVAELQKALPDDPRFAAPATDPAATGADAADPAAELAARQASIEARERAVAEREAAFAESARDERIAEDDAFLDGLVASGKLAPGLKPQFAAFCEALGESEGIAFSEGGAPEDPRAAFKALLAANLGTVIRFDEIADGSGLRFAEGRTIDDLASAIDAEMSAAATAGKPISAAEASRRAKARA